MYLKSFTIDRIKCFESVELRFPHDGSDYSGWIVLLGGNGTGKSTLLQAIALTLIGPLAGQRLLQPRGWARQDAHPAFGSLAAEIIRGEQDSQVGQPRKKPYEVSFAITGRDVVELDDQPYDQPQLVQLADAKNRKALVSGPHAARRPGWFSCGYGPFRRLSGGDAAEARIVYSPGAESRFATLFRESAALTTCQDWLTQLYAQSIDPNNPDRVRSGELFDTVRTAIDSLLPSPVRIDKIDTTTVYFRTIGGASVPVPDLSDGYRSFLALVVDMLRHIVDSGLELARLIHLTDQGVRIDVEGIVLIDEADAHLHPIWQRNLGFEMRRIFPRIQFIVTTHSPFVAQAATDNGLIVLQPDPLGKVEAITPVPSVRGWRADQILTSPLFGLTGTRDEETERLINEHAELVAKQKWHKMSTTDQGRLASLEDELAERISAPGETLEERKQQQTMKDYIEATLQHLGADQ